MRRCLRALPAAGPPLVLTAFAAGLLSIAAADPPPFTVGEIRLRTLNSGREVELRYRLKGGRMRIDRPGESVPTPSVNLLDLCHDTLRIIHPRNGTWQQIPAESPAPGGPARPLPPPDLGPRHAPDIRPRGVPGAPQAPAVPDLPPNIQRPFFPTVQPPPASWQAKPAPGVGPGAVAPPIPMLGNRPAPPLELVDTGETRELLGYTCSRHLISMPREGELTLWLARPGLLPPFHLLVDDVPRQPSWELRVASLLRETDRFPLLAELHEEGQLLVRWEVSAVHAAPVTDDSLFEVPVSYHRLDPPPPPPFDPAR